MKPNEFQISVDDFRCENFIVNLLSWSVTPEGLFFLTQ